MKKQITISTVINIPIERAWDLWTQPTHIMQWNNASPDWHTPRAESDLRVGGKFLSRMEAKDESMGFDFVGTFEEIIPNQLIKYAIADGRKVAVVFTANGNQTTVEESFEPENEHSIEMQQVGWQAILDNFKQYAECYCI